MRQIQAVCWSWLAAAVLTVVGCGGGGGGDGGGGDATPPTVTAVSPVNGASGVAATTQVKVTFSEPIYPVSVDVTTFTLSAGGVQVPAAVTTSSTSALLAPATELDPGTLYTATVKTGVRDLAGNYLAEPFVANFTTETLPWSGTRQFGTPNIDAGNAVTTDASGHIYVAGTTGEDLDGPDGDPYVGVRDFFLAKFDSDGTLLFTRQLGTVNADEAFAVAADGAGNVFVAGATGEDLDGPDGDPYAGASDFFLAKFDSDGTLLFTRQFGTVNADEAFGLTVTAPIKGGNVFITGETLGDLDGNVTAGNFDIFLMKFDPFGSLQ